MLAGFRPGPEYIRVLAMLGRMCLVKRRIAKLFRKIYNLPDRLSAEKIGLKKVEPCPSVERSRSPMR